MGLDELNKKVTEPHILDTIKNQRKSTTQELIKNLNIHENYEHSKLTEYETEQIIERLEEMDLDGMSDLQNQDKGRKRKFQRVYRSKKKIR